MVRDSGCAVGAVVAVVVAVAVCVIPRASAAESVEATLGLRQLNSAYPTSKYPTGHDPLFVVADQHVAQEDIVTLETLAGGLSRTTPRLYRVNTDVNGTDSYALWLRFMTQHHQVRVNRTYVHDLPGAVRHFSPSIAGYVTFNGSTESVNAAITFCAGSNDLVVAAGSASMESVLKGEGVPLIKDLTKATVQEVYHQVVGNLRLRGASFQPPSKSGNLAEYAVFARIPTLEYKGNTGGSLAQTVMRDIQRNGNNGFALGWGPEEQYVSTLGKSGIYVHASDWAMDVDGLSNLHVHSNVVPKRGPVLREMRRSSQRAERDDAREDRPADGDRHTVAFLMTDGDNIQWLLNTWATDEQWFGSSDRGKVPMGWTLSPGLVSLAPAVLEYAHAAASANDSFVSGPSGLGYIYPSSFSAMPSFANLTGAYMRAADLGIVNVIDNDLFSPTLLPLLQQSSVSSLFLYTGSCYAGPAGIMAWVGDKPVVTARAAMWGSGNTGQCLDVDAVVERVLSQPRNATRPSAYSLIPVHAWSHNMSDVLRAAEKLMRAGVDVVHPTEFVDRIKRNVVKRCPMPVGSYTDTCSDCSLDDNCMLTCKCKAPAHTQSATCNVQCCSDLGNNGGRLWCNGHQCPTAC